MTVLPMPAPISLTPFVIVKVLDHVAVPAGTMTVSPGLALEIAALTSAKEGLAALMTLAAVTVTVLSAVLVSEPDVTVKDTV